MTMRMKSIFLSMSAFSVLSVSAIFTSVMSAAAQSAEASKGAKSSRYSPPGLPAGVPVDVINEEPIPVELANGAGEPLKVMTVNARIPVFCEGSQLASSDGQTDFPTCDEFSSSASFTEVPEGYDLAITDFVVTTTAVGSAVVPDDGETDVVFQPARNGVRQPNKTVRLKGGAAETASLHLTSPYVIGGENNGLAVIPFFRTEGACENIIMSFSAVGYLFPEPAAQFADE